MFNLPMLIFQLAIADLRRLAHDTTETRVRGKDVAVGRKLVAESFRHLRNDQKPDPNHTATIREIADLALAFTTRHLEATQARQKSDPTYRLSSIDLAAMSLYQRSLKLQEQISGLEKKSAAVTGVSTHPQPGNPAPTTQPAATPTPTPTPAKTPPIPASPQPRAA